MLQDCKYISMLGPLHSKCKRCGERNRIEAAAYIYKNFRVCMSVCGICQRELAQKIKEWMAK